MKYSLLIGAALALASVSAHAAVPAFAELDADGNGLISQDEAAKSEVVMASFAAADVDKDGSLSLEEYQALR